MEDLVQPKFTVLRPENENLCSVLSLQAEAGHHVYPILTRGHGFSLDFFLLFPSGTLVSSFLHCEQCQLDNWQLPLPRHVLSSLGSSSQASPSWWFSSKLALHSFQGSARPPVSSGSSQNILPIAHYSWNLQSSIKQHIWVWVGLASFEESSGPQPAVILPPKDICQCLETFLVVTMGVCMSRLVDSDEG